MPLQLQNPLSIAEPRRVLHQPLTNELPQLPIGQVVNRDTQANHQSCYTNHQSETRFLAERDSTPQAEFLRRVDSQVRRKILQALVCASRALCPNLGSL